MADEFDEAGMSRRDNGRKPRGKISDRPPSDHLALIMADRNYGGVIVDADHACAVAELLLARHYGAAELEKQRPLIAEDKGDSWHVEGTWNRRQIPPGEPGYSLAGSFYADFWKYDGRVLGFARYSNIAPPTLEALREWGITIPPGKAADDSGKPAEKEGKLGKDD